MTPTKHPPILRVVDGAKRSTSRGHAELVEVAQRGHTVATQLGLPGVGPSRASLVWSTVGRLAQLGVGNVSAQVGARTIVDLRVAPAFRRLADGRDVFMNILAEHGVGYLHLAELGNRFAGESWDQERYRARLAGFYEANRASVIRLRRLIDAGPIIVMVSGYDAIESGLLIEALAGIRPRFETTTWK